MTLIQIYQYCKAFFVVEHRPQALSHAHNRAHPTTTHVHTSHPPNHPPLRKSGAAFCLSHPPVTRGAKKSVVESLLLKENICGLNPRIAPRQALRYAHNRVHYTTTHIYTGRPPAHPPTHPTSPKKGWQLCCALHPSKKSMFPNHPLCLACCVPPHFPPPPP